MNDIKQLIRKVENLIEENVDYAMNYFPLVREVLSAVSVTDPLRDKLLATLYGKIREQIICNPGKPVSSVKFGTSGWRGILGLDLFCRSVVQVVTAIADMYVTLEKDRSLAIPLGVKSLREAKERGCIIGFDNRFCGDLLATAAAKVLLAEGFTVYYAGETTTGVLSAAVLELEAAFSINFTPSHNPLQYGGLKFNAADAGPAAEELTTYITKRTGEIIAEGRLPASAAWQDIGNTEWLHQVRQIDSFTLWRQLVNRSRKRHGLVFDEILQKFTENNDVVVAVDSVHGASRLHIPLFFTDVPAERVIHLRAADDVTFGGVAPEPSSENIQGVISSLRNRPEKLRVGAIIDPDGDRIRFTDGSTEISMNQFGAMAYHFLLTYKKKKGPVAKTVATSNFANALAAALGGEIFETRVGFKEFKPIIGKALVCFEESDGISILGHTPEKDAYIGLLLALEMVLTTGKNLGEYLRELEEQYGSFYPARDGIAVNLQGDDLLHALAGLDKYTVGSSVAVGREMKKIENVIDIDGRKMIFEDASWIMIRPSGTEPKVRFYVEARTETGTAELVATAHELLRERHII